MAKKHIVKIGYQSFATDSITAANQVIAAVSKMTPVEWIYEGRGEDFYSPELTRDHEIVLKLNQEFRTRKEPKPERAKKAIALPAPKRGTIRCICDHSDVAPRQSCPHCGRPFSESHNRVHQDKSNEHGTHLRLL